ncbi:MAG: hypothetical protein RL653_2645 [Pseudomonadota bacterium]
MLRFRKLTSSFNAALYSDIVYRAMTRREGERRIPLDRFSPLNAWAELPREVQAEEGYADEAQLRSWLDEGWLSPLDLLEGDGAWTTFERSHLFGDQVTALARRRKERLHRVLRWAAALGLCAFLASRWIR